MNKVSPTSHLKIGSHRRASTGISKSAEVTPAWSRHHSIVDQVGEHDHHRAPPTAGGRVIAFMCTISTPMLEGNLVDSSKMWITKP